MSPRRIDHASHVLSRRRLLAGAGAAALGAFVLPACGSDSKDSDATDPSPSSAPTSPDSSAVITNPTAASATVTNKYGSYEIPLEPQRLMLMENRIELEIATALGLTPSTVGYFYEFVGGPAPWVAPWVPYTPTGSETTFESFASSTEYLLSVDPDLILSGATWLDGDDPAYWSYANLSNVAPIVPLAIDPDWRADLTTVAGWLQREDRLASTLAEFDALRDGIIAKHGDKLASAKVAMGSAEAPILWLNDFDSGSPASTALQQLGGQLMPFSDPSAVAFGWLELSAETIDELNGADAALLWGPDEDSRNVLTTNPLWESIPAVAAERVVMSEQNVGSGHLYTVMECMRLWDKVYDTLD